MKKKRQPFTVAYENRSHAERIEEYLLLEVLRNEYEREMAFLFRIALDIELKELIDNLEVSDFGDDYLDANLCN